MLVAGNTAGGNDTAGFGDDAGYMGYAGLGARVRAKPVPPSRAIKGLQNALRLLARAARDGSLMVGVDGRPGPRTVAAVNNAFTRHIGAGQAPAALRTGRLTAADVAKNAQTLGVLALTEVKRRRAAVTGVKRVARRPAPAPRPAAVRRFRPIRRPGTIIPGPTPGPMPMPGPAPETMTPPEFEPAESAEVAPPEEAMPPPRPDTMTPPEFEPEQEAVAEEAPEAPSEEAAAEEVAAESGEEAPADAETAGAVDSMSTANKVVLGGTILGLAGAIGFGLWQMSKAA